MHGAFGGNGRQFGHDPGFGPPGLPRPILGLGTNCRFNWPISARFEVWKILHVARLIRLNLRQYDTPRWTENARSHLRLCNALGGFQVSEAAMSLTPAAMRHPSLSNDRSAFTQEVKITLFESKKSS